MLAVLSFKQTGLQGSFKCAQRFDQMCLISEGREFQTKGTAQEKARCPDVLVVTCGMHRVVESEEEWSCVD